MDQDFYIEETSPFKIIISVVIFVFLIFGLVFFYMMYNRGNNVKPKNLTIELGDVLSKDINTYINVSNPGSYTLDLSNVSVDENGKVNVTGEYSYKIKKSGEVKKGKIYVKDTTKPVVEIDELTVGVNEDFSPNDYLVKCDDLSLPCSVRFKNAKDLELNSKEGTYSTTIIISDSEGNEVVKNTRLIVSGENTLTNKKASDLNFDHLSEDDLFWDKSYTIRLDKGVFEESVKFEELIASISTKKYDFDKKIADKKILIAYNKYNYVIGFSVKVTFDDNSIIYVTKDNATEKVEIEETDAENLKNA